MWSSWECRFGASDFVCIALDGLRVGGRYRHGAGSFVRFGVVEPGLSAGLSAGQDPS